MIIIKDSKHFTEYGISVKVRLMRLGRKQSWLIEELRKKFPDRYIDSSYLSKIFYGTVNSPKIVKAINEILMR